MTAKLVETSISKLQVHPSVIYVLVNRLVQYKTNYIGVRIDGPRGGVNWTFFKILR